MHDADLYERLRPQREAVAETNRKLIAHEKASRPTGQVCTKCHEDKPFDQYPPNKKVKSGRSSWCRTCHRAATNAHQARLRADALAYRATIDA